MANTAVAFETIHFVFGSDIKTISADQLINAVKRVEGEIADLKVVKAKSSHIKKRIEELIFQGALYIRFALRVDLSALYHL